MCKKIDLVESKFSTTFAAVFEKSLILDKQHY